MTDVSVRDPFSDSEPALEPGDPFEDPDAPVWPRTFDSEGAFLEAARELLVCADCERAERGVDGEACPEAVYVTGCLFWKRRAGA